MKDLVDNGAECVDRPREGRGCWGIFRALYPSSCFVIAVNSALSVSRSVGLSWLPKILPENRLNLSCWSRVAFRAAVTPASSPDIRQVRAAVDAVAAPLVMDLRSMASLAVEPEPGGASRLLDEADRQTVRVPLASF